MKNLIAIVGICLASGAMAACTRERGEELLKRFYSDVAGEVVTNGMECARTVVDGLCECRYFYPVQGGPPRRIRVKRADGGVDIYDYRDGRLDSAAWCHTNNETMVMTLFVGNGMGSNQVDRIETRFENGKICGAVRVLDVTGKEIKVPKPKGHSFFEVEYVPEPGSTGRFGPYEWTVIGKGDHPRNSLLSRGGKKVIAASFCLGGKYPWLVGYGHEEFATADRKELRGKGIVVNKYSGASYYFVIDMRTDHIEYVPEDKAGEIDKIIGFPERSIDMYGFWDLFLSRRGPERLAKLEAALRPPEETSQGSESSVRSPPARTTIPVVR